MVVFPLLIALLHVHREIEIDVERVIELFASL
jgi:hypothetical protein